MFQMKMSENQKKIIFTEHKKTTAYDVGNTGPGLRRVQNCGGVKPFNGIPTVILLS